MKQTIPFIKDIKFQTNISEITSISLEHDYKLIDDIISGDFIISGDYKIHDASIEKEDFIFTIPFDIDLTSKYNVLNCELEIDDFYYELVDNNIMKCHIDVVIDGLEEKVLDVEIKEEENYYPEQNQIEGNRVEIIDDNEIEVIDEINENFEDAGIPIINEMEEIKENIIDENPMGLIKEKITEEKPIDLIKESNVEELKNLFGQDNNEIFKTYKIYIIRDNDTIETVTTKYGVSKEILKEYNEIDNIKLNDKIIIPCINE